MPIIFTILSLIVIVAMGVYSYLNETYRILSYIAIGLLLVVLVIVIVLIKKNSKSTVEISNKYDYD